jgi:hypothetical protein
VIRLNASLSKKVPIPDVDFSSQQFGAAVEVEVSDGADAWQIAAKLQQLYGLLERSVQEQIDGATRRPRPRRTAPRLARREETRGEPEPTAGDAGEAPAPSDNGKATPAQANAILTLTKGLDMTPDDLAAFLQAESSVSSLEDLSLREAAEIITRLQRTGERP